MADLKALMLKTIQAFRDSGKTEVELLEELTGFDKGEILATAEVLLIKNGASVGDIVKDALLIGALAAIERTKN